MSLDKGSATSNLRALHRFHRICERFSIAPTYLVTCPVMEDALAVEELGGWRESGTCEIGAHCHPWCTPPFLGNNRGVPQTYLNNLPKDEQFAKIQNLTELIENRIGERPSSFRAGRYGFGPSTAECLLELSYRVDSSIVPLFDYRNDSGPDFRYQTNAIRTLGRTNSGCLVELPITTGFSEPGFAMRRWLWNTTRRFPWKQLKVPGLLDRCGWAERVKLSPEGYQASQLRNLIDCRIRERDRCLVFTLHSSSLMAGTSPYSSDERATDRVYDCLKKTFMYISELTDLTPMMLTEAADFVLGSGTCLEVNRLE